MFKHLQLQVGWETLKEEFLKLMERAKKGREHDDIFDQLKVRAARLLFWSTDIDILKYIFLLADISDSPPFWVFFSFSAVSLEFGKFVFRPSHILLIFKDFEAARTRN